ncbi:MAG: non-canonical purine NTP pyrophosphatase, partial [Aeromicrobium sp.]
RPRAAYRHRDVTRCKEGFLCDAPLESRVLRPPNNDLLLLQIGDVPDERRTAQFRCAVALCVPGGGEFIEQGEMKGRILRGTQGDGGFGYDPLFAADGHDVSTAELTPQEKDLISHRGKALRAIAPHVIEALRN